MSRYVEPLAALAILAAAIAWSLLSIAPPQPLGSDAEAGLFSAGRARKHVEQIAQEPHPTGSPANRKARDYVAEAFRQAGLDVSIHKAVESGTTVENVVAVRKGAVESGPVLLLASHYDSTSAGPGAADCAAGVATLLETARVLGQTTNMAGPEILFLVTDGEERGLLGAKAFVREHAPLVRRIRAALNFEARGVRGPVVMFETGSDNYALVRALSRVCARPVACSFAQEVYKRMPNDTDFTVFRQAGLKGLNFAVVVGLDYYHTPQDKPENLDSGSLQHYGDYAARLALLLAGDEGKALLEQAPRGDGVFFPAGPGWLVCYPSSWVLPLAAAAFLLTALTLGLGIRQGRLKLGSVLACTGLWLLFVVGSCLLAIGCVKAIFVFLKPNHYNTFVMNLRGTGWMLVGILALVFVLGVALRTWMTRRWSPENLVAGGVILWLPLTVSSALHVPGGSYFFLWPMLGAILALGLLFRAAVPSHLQRILALALIVAPSAMVFAPMIYLLHHTMTIGLAPACVAPVALAFALVPFPTRFSPPAGQEPPRASPESR